MSDRPTLSPIPSPPAQRWREARLRYLPRTVFFLGLLLTVYLWNRSSSTAIFVAEAEIDQVDVCSAVAGVVSLSVGMLRPVRAGQVVAKIFPPSTPVYSSITGQPPESVSAVASMDGVVSRVLRRPGEFVAAGETILRVEATRSKRLKAFIRQPLPFEPKPGMIVEIRTRTASPQMALTKILQVGSTMEAISPALRRAMRMPTKSPPEFALRIYLAMPQGLKIRPGEDVDVLIH